MAPRKTTPKKPEHLTVNQEEELLLLALEHLKARLTDDATTPGEVSKCSSELRQVLLALRRISNEAPANPETDPIEAIRMKVAGLR